MFFTAKINDRKVKQYNYIEITLYLLDSHHCLSREAIFRGDMSLHLELEHEFGVIVIRQMLIAFLEDICDKNLIGFSKKQRRTKIAFHV